MSNISRFTLYLMLPTLLLLFSQATYSQGVRISGFGTVTMGSTLDSEKPLGFYKDDVQFKPESLAGVQLYSDIGSKTSATLQLTSRGMNDFDTKIEWLYLTYILDRNWSFKVGKFRTPFYNYSESLDIGYSYHWIRPPQSVYIPLFNNMEGASAMYRSVYGEIDSNLQLFYGTLHETSPGGSVDIDFMAGFSWSLQKDWLSMRASYFKSKVTIPAVFASAAIPLLPAEANPMAMPGPPGPEMPKVSVSVANAILPQGDSATNAGIALKAEFDDWMVLGEYTHNKVDDSIFTNPVGYYVSFVYFWGKFQPHITYERFDTEPQYEILDMVADTDPVKPLLRDAIGRTDEDKKTYTLGVKYNLDRGTAVKIDYSYTDFKIEVNDPVRPQLDAGVLSASVSFIF
ncbi:porin [Pseudoalteromonas sp. JBTF-M23]|uniref:Porin n=1 Tax=Pseudoalteromonas caenipelagi TaxID=2726988 RepID=A0A849VJK6_9GAMM|nr:porin [Pseudoalteromonas caenipelagi]NOU51984.1 porin [Pseudoalteromonas caenipelagi]